jgi:Ca-activated chloride channel family protein
MTGLLQDFHFLRPLWFLALVPALLLVMGLWLQQRRSQQWLRYIAPNLLPYLLDQVQMRERKWPLLALLALWGLATFALAGPVWEKIPQPVERNNQALVICWDLSPSMLAEDVKPSRLVRARLKLIDLLQARKDGQVALIAYSGEAYTVTPLTDDRQTLINLLPALSPTTLPTVGSNPEMALTQALRLLKDGGVHRGDILFLTDEIEPVALEFMADELSSTPHQLTLWGIGTEQGAPIPLPEGGFAKNRQGDMVVARLNENQLQQFARRHSFYYVPVTPTGSDIETLVQLLSPQIQDTRRSDRVFDLWFEHGQYLCLLLLPGLLWLFRRGLIFCVLALALLPLGYSQEARAFEWRDLWLNQDQRAERDLAAGDATAATRFSSPQRRGTALYQQGEYESAAQEFAQNSDPISLYNQGTALTRAGKLEDAIKAFDRALELQPDFPQAEHNRAIAQQLAELRPQSEQGQEQQQKGNSKDKSDQSQSDQQQNGEGQQQSSEGSGEEQQTDSQGAQGQSKESGEPEEMSEEQAQQRMAEQSESDAQNPYSAAKPETGDQEREAERLQAQQAEDSQKDGEESDSHAYSGDAPMTEEQQMLEQWLRKVPDDPSGLMRNKFKYQYLQRRQNLRGQGPSNPQAEQRW